MEDEEEEDDENRNIPKHWNCNFLIERVVNPTSQTSSVTFQAHFSSPQATLPTSSRGSGLA